MTAVNVGNRPKNNFAMPGAAEDEFATISNIQCLLPPNIRGRRDPETMSTCGQGARTGAMTVGMYVGAYLYNPRHANCEHIPTGRPYGDHVHVHVWAKKTPHTETVRVCEQGDPAEVTVEEC